MTSNDFGPDATIARNQLMNHQYHHCQTCYSKLNNIMIKLIEFFGVINCIVWPEFEYKKKTNKKTNFHHFTATSFDQMGMTLVSINLSWSYQSFRWHEQYFQRSAAQRQWLSCKMSQFKMSYRHRRTGLTAWNIIIFQTFRWVSTSTHTCLREKWEYLKALVFPFTSFMTLFDAGTI